MLKQFNLPLPVLDLDFAIALVAAAPEPFFPLEDIFGECTGCEVFVAQVSP